MPFFFGEDARAFIGEYTTSRQATKTEPALSSARPGKTSPEVEIRIAND